MIKTVRSKLYPQFHELHGNSDKVPKL